MTRTAYPVPAAQPSMPAAIPAALALVLVLHGAFSAPVPARLGPAELAVAAALLAATGLARPALVVGGLGAARDRADQRRCLAAAGLIWVPTLLGLLQGYAPAAVLRDVIPLGFVLVPLALPRPARPGLAPQHLADAAAGAGVLLALRHLALAGWLPGSALAQLALSGPPAHLLANDILVTFAAVWLPVRAVRQTPSVGGALAALGILAAAGAATAGLAHNLHRAGLAAAALSWSASLAAGLLRPATRRMALVAAAAAGAAWVAAAPQMGELGQLLWLKTQLLGINGRLAELTAALDVAARSPATALIGHGWGFHWANPAAGAASVAYTHNAVTYLLLKTGLLGVAAALAAVAEPALRGWAGLWRQDRGLAAAAALTLGIGTLIHADFKTLSYGILLALVTAPAARTA